MLKYEWTEETQEVGRLEEELDKDAECHRRFSICTSITLPTGLLKVWRLQNRSTSNSHREVCKQT